MQVSHSRKHTCVTSHIHCSWYTLANNKAACQCQGREGVYCMSWHDLLEILDTLNLGLYQSRIKLQPRSRQSYQSQPENSPATLFQTESLFVVAQLAFHLPSSVHPHAFSYQLYEIIHAKLSAFLIVSSVICPSSTLPVPNPCQAHCEVIPGPYINWDVEVPASVICWSRMWYNVDGAASFRPLWNHS